MDLYFFPSPNGIKVAIMLEECGLPYRIVPVDITRGDQFHPDFLRLSPNAKIPALVDRDAEGGPLSLFESGAILLYLARRSGRFFPATEREVFEALPWLFWQVAHLGPMAGQAHYFREFAAQRDGHATTRFSNEMNRLYGVLERRLEGRDFIAGDYGIIDMACWPWVFHHPWQGQSLQDWPAVRAWFERVAARPAVQRARQLGLAQQVDPERYRDVLHNQTAAQAEDLAREALARTEKGR